MECVSQREAAERCGADSADDSARLFTACSTQPLTTFKFFASSVGQSILNALSVFLIQ